MILQLRLLRWHQAMRVGAVIGGGGGGRVLRLWCDIGRGICAGPERRQCTQGIHSVSGGHHYITENFLPA